MKRAFGIVLLVFVEIFAFSQGRENSELAQVTEAKKKLEGVQFWRKISAGQWESTYASSASGKYNPERSKFYTLEYKGQVWQAIGFETSKFLGYKYPAIKKNPISMPLLDLYIFKPDELKINLLRDGNAKNLMKGFYFLQVESFYPSLDKDGKKLKEAVTLFLDKVIGGKQSIGGNKLAIPTFYWTEENVVRFAINEDGRLSEEHYLECSYNNFTTFFPCSLE